MKKLLFIPAIALSLSTLSLFGSQITNGEARILQAMEIDALHTAKGILHEFGSMQAWVTHQKRFFKEHPELPYSLRAEFNHATSNKHDAQSWRSYLTLEWIRTERHLPTVERTETIARRLFDAIVIDYLWILSEKPKSKL